MKRKTLTGLIAVLAVSALMSMSIIQADGHCEFADEAITFGGIAPMSAPGAVDGGAAMDWAFGQAAADLNADCGIEIDGVNYQIQVITGDSEGSPERGQAVAERLILEDGANGMVGVYHSAVGLATMGIMQENRIPTVFSEPWSDSISANGIIEYDGAPPRIEDGVDYIFRVAPSSSMVRGIVTDWLIALGAEDVVLIAAEHDQSAAVDEQTRLEAAGVTVDLLALELDAEDFAPMLSRIQARPEPPDAIRIMITGETSFSLTQQMAELGIAPTEDTICVTNQIQIAFQSDLYWATAPDGNYCAFNRVGSIPSLFNDMAIELNAKYEAEFGDIIPSFGMASYDSVYLLADAIERANTYTDPDAVAAAIENSDIELSQARYYFTYGSHNPELPEGTPTYMWHQWPDPIVTVMQYFEQGQSALDAAVVYPEVYQTHGSAYIVPGTSP